MSALTIIVVGLAIAAPVVWAALANYVLVVQRRRTSAHTQLSTALATLTLDDVRALPLADRVSSVRPMLAELSREMLMHAASDRATPADAFDVLAAYMVERWAGRLEDDAASHRTARDKWRRMTAFRILDRLNHPATMTLLSRAVDEHDMELADAGFALLGQSTDARAMDILLDALKRHRHPAAQIASHIEHSPQPIGGQLKALLDDADPIVRFWGATLLARYPDEPLEFELATLTNDRDPRVRKAAMQTLGSIGGDLAATCAQHLLTDPFPYVRAHAARALAALGRTDRAADVAVLLGDSDWWTRLAARESLQLMGTDVWPVLMRCLNHNDGFVRNGAAEVMQNIGVLDSLIVMEAASDHPAPAKIAMLRKIASAGGVRFTDALVDRASSGVGSRVRHVLAAIGLERVGAA